MRRGIFIGGLLAALVLAVPVAAPAFAQSTSGIRQPPPRVTPPKVQPPRVVMAIRPSQAAMIAQRAFMGAKVLGVKPRGKKYVITVKVKDEVRQVTVNGETGVLE